MTLRISLLAIALLACGDDDSIDPDAGMDAAGDTGRRDTGTDAGEDAAVDATPDAGGPTERVVFQRIPFDIGTPSGVYVAAVDGSIVERISPVAETQRAPRPSPDGTRVFYEDDTGAWVMNADGTGATMVLAWSPTRERGFEWASDGTKLIYLHDVRTVPDVATEILEVTPGASPVQLHAAGSLGEPELSPDGTRLVYTNGGNIWTSNADGGDPLAIVTDAERLNQPTFSPDGLRIAYHVGFVGGASGSIVVVGADGSSPVTVGMTGDAPEWSPDGSLIAYRTAAGLRVVGPDGTGDRELTTGNISFHSWSPDGSRILYLDGGTIQIVSVADGETTTVTTGENDTFPGWLASGG